MRKRVLLFIVVVILLVSLGGVFYHKTFVVNDKAPDAVTDEQVQNGEIVAIAPESVNGITQEEAEKLCYFVMGEKDEETGFLFSFGVSGAVKAGKKQYYVIRASWLVDNSHLSYIGDFFVASDGKEIYSGTALPGENGVEYTMDTVIWKK